MSVRTKSQAPGEDWGAICVQAQEREGNGDVTKINYVGKKVWNTSGKHVAQRLHLICSCFLWNLWATKVLGLLPSLLHLTLRGTPASSSPRCSSSPPPSTTLDSTVSSRGEDRAVPWRSWGCQSDPCCRCGAGKGMRQPSACLSSFEFPQQKGLPWTTARNKEARRIQKSLDNGGDMTCRWRLNCFWSNSYTASSQTGKPHSWEQTPVCSERAGFPWSQGDSKVSWQPKTC